MNNRRTEVSLPDTDIYASVWLVRCGARMVGPVSLELIARGLDAGRIPEDAEMTHIDHPEWRPVTTPIPIPDAPPSVHFPDEPISTPMLGVIGSMFG